VLMPPPLDYMGWQKRLGTNSLVLIKKTEPYAPDREWARCWMTSATSAGTRINFCVLTYIAEDNRWVEELWARKSLAKTFA